MKRMIPICPSCSQQLQIAALKCSACGLELRNDFELSVFDQLDAEQYGFLISFLKNRGSLKGLQSDLRISYPLAKKKLDELLDTLGLDTGRRKEAESLEVDTSQMEIDTSSRKASEIIKQKLKDAGGRVSIRTATGLPCEVTVCPDGHSFASDKLPIKPPFRFEVFDVITNLLVSNGGRARKGNGRQHRLGHPDCDESTVVGAIALHYSGKQIGDWVFDPVFVLGAILEWAGIVTNARGELILTASYTSLS